MSDRRAVRVAKMLPALRAIHPPDAMQRMRRTDLAVGNDGRATPYALGASLGHLSTDWYISGTLATGTAQNKQARIVADGVIERLDITVKTAPTGADLIVQLNQNGVALGTATIAAGDTSGFLALDEPCLAGDLLTLDITQVGSTVAGSNLTATVTYREERGS
jgi:hypothetical protein